jgi:Importin-beta N-terminal domain
MTSQATQQVYSVLVGTLSNNTPEREAATAKLEEFKCRAGFGAALVHILANSSLADYHRQLAGVLLKQYVDEHWNTHSPNFKEPVAPDNEKAEIRKTIPTLLPHANSKLRTAASMVIGVIGRCDFPEHWPDLLTNLLKCIQSNDPHMIQGSLRALGMFAEYVTDEQLAGALPQLFPALLRIAGAPADKVPADARAEAFAIYGAVAPSILTVVESGHKKDYRRAIKQLLLPTLDGWMKLILRICEQIKSLGKGVLENNNSNPDMVNSRSFQAEIKAISVLFILTEQFPDAVKPHMDQILQTLFGVLKELFPVLERFTLNANCDFERAVDREGSFVDLQSFFVEVLQFFSTALQTGFRRSLLAGLDDVMLLIAGLAQPADSDVQDWECDASSYAAFEEDCFQLLTIRSAAMELIVNMLTSFQKRAIVAASKAAQSRVNQAVAIMRSSSSPANSPHGKQSTSAAIGAAPAWKYMEAAMLVLGSLADYLDMGDESTNQAHSVLKAFILNQAEANVPNPFLRARALWSASHYFAYIKDQSLGERTIDLLSQSVQPSCHVIVRLAGIRALGFLASMSSDPTFVDDDSDDDFQPDSKSIMSAEERRAMNKYEWIRLVLCPIVPRILPCIAQFIASAEHDSLHTALTALSGIVDVDPNRTAEAEPKLTPLLLNAWSAHSNDPKAVSAIDAVFTELFDMPQCLKSLQERVLPVLIKILADSHKHQSGTVESALLMIETMVQSCHKHKHPYHPLILQQAYSGTITLMMTSDDGGIIEAAGQVLSSYLWAIGPKLALGKLGDRPMIDVLTDAILFLLHPRLIDTVAVPAGTIVSQLFSQLWDQLGQDRIQRIISATLLRLSCTYALSLSQSLLKIFARMVHRNPNTFVEIMMKMGRITGTVPVKSNFPASHADRAAGSAHAHVHATESEDRDFVALPFLLQKWTEEQSSISGKYLVNLLLSALCKLVQLDNDKINSLPVRGYSRVEQNNDSKQNGSKKYFTRGASKAGAAQQETLVYSQIPFATRVMSLLLQEWNSLVERDLKNKNKKGGAVPDNAADWMKQFISGLQGDDGSFNENDSGDEFDFGGDDDDAFTATLSTLGGDGAAIFAPAGDSDDEIDAGRQFLSDIMGNYYDDDAQHEEELIDPEAGVDPLKDLNLIEFLENFVSGFAQHNNQGFRNTVQALSSGDNDYLGRMRSKVHS